MLALRPYEKRWKSVKKKEKKLRIPTWVEDARAFFSLSPSLSFFKYRCLGNVRLTFYIRVVIDI